MPITPARDPHPLRVAAPFAGGLLLLLACPPGEVVDPGGETTSSTAAGETFGEASTSVASASSTTSTSSTSSTSDATTTTGDASTTSTSTATDATSSTSTTTEDTTTADTGCGESTPQLPTRTPLHCPLELPPNADVQGTTPLGAVAATHAWTGLFACECGTGGPYIVLVDDPQDLADALLDQHLTIYEGPGLVVEGYDYDSEAMSYNGVHEVQVTHRVACAAEEAAGTLTITASAPFAWPSDPMDPVTLTGELVVEGGGWSVSGTFTATACDHLFVATP